MSWQDNSQEQTTEEKGVEGRAQRGSCHDDVYGIHKWMKDYAEGATVRILTSYESSTAVDFAFTARAKGQGK